MISEIPSQSNLRRERGRERRKISYNIPFHWGAALFHGLARYGIPAHESFYFNPFSFFFCVCFYDTFNYYYYYFALFPLITKLPSKPSGNGNDVVMASLSIHVVFAIRQNFKNSILCAKLLQVEYHFIARCSMATRRSD